MLYYKLGGFLLVVVSIILYMVFGSNNPFLSASKIRENAQIASGEQKPNTVIDSQASSVTTQQPQNNDLSFECRKAVNIEKPECIKWFDDLSKIRAVLLEISLRIRKFHIILKNHSNNNIYNSRLNMKSLLNQYLAVA